MFTAASTRPAVGLRRRKYLRGRPTPHRTFIEVAALEGGLQDWRSLPELRRISTQFWRWHPAATVIVAQERFTSSNLRSTHCVRTALTTFVHAHNLDELKARSEEHQVVYVETLGNPNSDIPNVDAIAEIACQTRHSGYCRQHLPYRACSVTGAQRDVVVFTTVYRRPWNNSGQHHHRRRYI